jgi:hypothetical protein
LIIYILVVPGSVAGEELVVGAEREVRQLPPLAVAALGSHELPGGQVPQHGFPPDLLHGGARSLVPRVVGDREVLAVRADRRAGSVSAGGVGRWVERERGEFPPGGGVDDVNEAGVPPPATA